MTGKKGAGLKRRKEIFIELTWTHPPPRQGVASPLSLKKRGGKQPSPQLALLIHKYIEANSE